MRQLSYKRMSSEQWLLGCHSWYWVPRLTRIGLIYSFPQLQGPKSKSAATYYLLKFKYPYYPYKKKAEFLDMNICWIFKLNFNNSLKASEADSLNKKVVALHRQVIKARVFKLIQQKISYTLATQLLRTAIPMPQLFCLKNRPLGPIL